MNFEEICMKAVALVKEVGAYVHEEGKNIRKDKIETKSKNNFVTEVDKASEERLVKGLRNILPEAGFLTEEGTVKNTESDCTWIIDPIDGTTNFIHGIPCYAISVGLMHNNEIVIGIIFEVNLEECFYAWKGSKAYLNGKEISVSPTEELGNSLIATGFPYDTYIHYEKYLSVLKSIMKHTRGIRRLGSASVDMAYVACGRFDGFYEKNLSPWDVAGGILIVKQAGGNLYDFTGGDNYLFGKTIIAGNAHILEPLKELIKSHKFD